MPISKVFYENTKTSKGSLPVQELFGFRNKIDGQVGLELECEGRFFPKSQDYYAEDYGDTDYSDEIPQEWLYTHDGSLRGLDNAEYILRNPLSFEQAYDAIDSLWEMFYKVDSGIEESNRTSLHVHLNARDWYLDRVCSFVSLYYIVEDILTHWCGEHRVGNLFCLRAKDAPGLVSRTRKFLQTENSSFYFTGGMHYSGLNLLALQKLGSIEVRAMRGPTTPEEAKFWVSVLERLYHLSGTYDNPAEIIHGFSGQSRDDFLREILGPHTDRIVAECGMTTVERNKSLHEGVRLAQLLCLCRDWSQYRKTKVEYDTFKRPKHSLAPEPIPVDLVSSPSISFNLMSDISDSDEHYEDIIPDWTL